MANDAFDNAQTDKEMNDRFNDAAFRAKIDAATAHLPAMLADIKEAEMNRKAGRTLNYIKRTVRNGI